MHFIQLSTEYDETFRYEKARTEEINIQENEYSNNIGQHLYAVSYQSAISIYLISQIKIIKKRDALSLSLSCYKFISLFEYIHTIIDGENTILYIFILASYLRLSTINTDSRKKLVDYAIVVIYNFHNRLYS